jgi:hypothetical protein
MTHRLRHLVCLRSSWHEPQDLARPTTGLQPTAFRSGRPSCEKRTAETIVLVRPESDQQKQLAQSLSADNRLEALDRRRRVQPIEPGKVDE